MTIEIMPPGSNIFASGAEALVDPVDASTGAQGKGLAKLFMYRYPAACQAFKRFARATPEFMAGNVWPFQAMREPFPRHWILFTATKEHWREPSEIEFIRRAMVNVVDLVLACGARSVAVPALGCGLGELAWDDVRPLLIGASERLSATGVRVLIYEPHEAIPKRSKVR